MLFAENWFSIRFSFRWNDVGGSGRLEVRRLPYGLLTDQIVQPRIRMNGFREDVDQSSSQGSEQILKGTRHRYAARNEWIDRGEGIEKQSSSNILESLQSGNRLLGLYLFFRLGSCIRRTHGLFQHFFWDQTRIWLDEMAVIRLASK